MDTRRMSGRYKYTKHSWNDSVTMRPGPCPHCGRGVELTSCDTRLWFVVVFIPIIPLARKHIVDYCPSCTRHYALDLQKWEMSRQLEISGALDKFRTSPTPEDAIAARQQLLNSHQIDQAAEFRRLMLEKFADNAKVQAYLGAALEHLGKFDEAKSYYARALALQHPSARSELVTLARRLNVDRSFPFHLIQPATTEAR